MNDVYSESDLSKLIGAELYAIYFVLDYLQFPFQPSGILCLNAYNPTSVIINDVIFRPNQPGWRDALCTCIGKKVISASVTKNEVIRLAFEGNVSIVISLNPDEFIGPEAAELRDGRKGGKLMVWRQDGAFEFGC